MIATITGNNSYETLKRLKVLRNEFKDNYGDLAVERIDGSEVTAEAIIEAVKSPPFLAARKMVIVRDLSQNKAAADQIEQIISSITDQTDLIVYEPSIDRRTSLYKVLKQQTQFEEYIAPEGSSLIGWLVNEAKNQAAKLSPSEARQLVERVGDNQQLLAAELDKLVTNSLEISRNDIENLVPKTPQTKVFDLLDAAFGGRKGRALELYGEQRALKVEPQAIFALMVWQLELIALAKAAKGKSATDIARQAGVSPYPVGKAQQLAAKLSDSRLEELIEEAYRIDLRSKTAVIDIDEALKTYITTL